MQIGQRRGLVVADVPPAAHVPGRFRAGSFAGRCDQPSPQSSVRTRSRWWKRSISEGNKTKDFLKILKSVAGTAKVLVVNAGENRKLELSSRNIPDVKVVPGTGVNIKDIVSYPTVVFSKDAILQVQEVLSR